MSEYNIIITRQFDKAVMVATRLWNIITPDERLRLSWLWMYVYVYIYIGMSERGRRDEGKKKQVG
jgi:hypothetical protein